MKKSALVKIYLFLVIILFSSIMSFSYAISDTDTSALITKAELDSLKNDYQARIDKYNVNLENKIDNAIASYLAGIKVDTTPKNFFDIYKGGNGGSPLFYWSLPGVGVEDHPAKVDVFFDKEFAYKVYSQIKYSGYFWSPQDGKQGTEQCTAAVDGGIIFGSDPNWSGSNGGWTNLWYRAPRPKTTVDSNDNKFVNFSINTVHAAWNPDSSITDMSTTVKTKKVTNNVFLSPTDTPSWTVLSDNGKNSLYLYQTNTCPYLVLNVHRHVYKNFGSLTTSYYMSDGGKVDYDSSKTTVEVDTTTNYGEKIDGTNYTGTDTHIGNYIRQNMQKLEINNGVDYRMAVFPIEDRNICYLPTIPELRLEIDDTTQTISDQNWYDVYWSTMLGGQMQTNKLYGMDLKYKRPTFKSNVDSIRSFEIPTISSLIGSTVYHGQGFPILESLSDDTHVKITIKMKNNLDDTSNVTCLFSENRFEGNNFAPGSRISITKEFACNTNVEVEIRELQKNDVIWMNPVAGAGDYVYIDSITIKKIS